MARILDLEQALLLLELEAPFDQRQVQLARRRMAKRWHPDIAPPGPPARAPAPPAGDQRGRRPARAPGRGLARRHRQPQRRQGLGRGRAQGPRGGGPPRLRGRAARPRRTPRTAPKYDPFGSRVPDHSVVHRYARCLAYPEWGVGTVSGIYFSGEGDDVQQWARMSFQVGVRTVPAGSLQFVDFSKPDPGADRVERFMTAAQHALAEGDPALAAQRLIYARDADPSNPAVLRLLTVAFWQVGQPAGGRPRRARLGPGRDRPPDRRALRLADLRGHGRHRPRRRRRRARHRTRARGRLRLGAARAACGCG